MTSPQFSPEELRAILRNDLMTFIEASFLELNPESRFLSSPHIEVMASTLERCLRGEVRRLVINLPPRSLKSHSISVALPAFLLGHRPEAKIICASYGQELSDKLARDCRTLMGSSFYRSIFPQTQLSTKKQSVAEFETTAGGVRLSTSVGGVLTGRGGDFIILDDPLKPDDALSESRRKAVNDWYSNTLLSRLDDKAKGVIIIVMQRLHQDDLVGHVLEQGGWEVLSFPAIAVEEQSFDIQNVFGKKVYRRKEGDALQPERESIETLRMIRSTIGDYNFSSQYQQNPTPLGGTIVKSKWLQYYERGEEPEFDHIVQSWDTASKAGDLNDYSVCTTWGFQKGKPCYLLDVYRERLDFPGLKRAAKAQAELHNADTILIEDRASGTQLLQELAQDGLYGVKPYLPPSGNDKIMRLYNQTTVFEMGHVLLPKRASWLLDYVSELLAFPGSKFDDQVDSTTQALDFMRSVLNRLSIYDVL